MNRFFKSYIKLENKNLILINIVFFKNTLLLLNTHNTSPYIDGLEYPIIVRD